MKKLKRFIPGFRDKDTAQKGRRHQPGGNNEGRAAGEESSSYGFKVLYEPSHAEVEVDIIAIHGLDGHREESFTAFDQGGTSRLWLRDFLPQWIPNARILTYGYNASTHGTSPLSHQTLRGHAEDMVVRLAAIRQEESEARRPIIFLAHGVGGIVVQLTLLSASLAHETHLPHHQNLKFSTFGIIFLGTPHHGYSSLPTLEQLNTSGLESTSNRLTKHLDANSEYLQDLLSMFTSISGGLDIVFIHELRVAAGSNTLVVERHSAVVNGMANTRVLGMEREHASLVKFTSVRDGDYLVVAQLLEGMAKNAPQRVEAHWKTLNLGPTADIKTLILNLQESLEQKIEKLEIAPKEALSLSLFNEGLPPPPLHILGREFELAQFRDILLNNPAPRVAILGPGGIGKTTIARQLLNDPAVIEKFPSTFFVSCDSVTSITALLNTIADSLLLPADQRGQSLAVNVLQTLRSRKGCLLCLDNFEDPWDPPETRGDIERLLESLGGLGGMGIVLTMRGSERPRGVKWNHPLPHPLEPLEDEPALQLFYQVSGIAEDQRVPMLMSEVENVPLAIELLARQVELDGLDDVLKRWQKDGLRLVDRGDKSDKRLTSVTASIELSLHGPRIAHIPHIHEVARMLAELPNGLSNSMVEALQVQLGNEFDVARCLRELIRAAVIYLDAAGRYRILAPIRQYIHSTIRWMSSVRDALRSTFFQHIINHIQVEYHPVVAPELSNIRHFVTASEGTWDKTHIEACLGYLWWEDYLLGIQDIDLALVALSHSNTPILEARCRFSISQLLQFSSRYAEAEGYIRPALSLKTGNLFWEGCVQMEMGGILRALDQYEEAEGFLREAANLFKESDEPSFEAEALRSLGTLFQTWGRFSDAEEPLKRSLELAKKEGSILSEGNALLELGKVYQSTARVSEAEDCHLRAITLYQQSHTILNEAHALWSLGDVLQSLERVEEAERRYLKAQELFRQINDSVSEAMVLDELGVLLTRSEARRDSAEQHLQDALVIFQLLERWGHQAYVHKDLGDLFLLQRRFSEAITHFVLSIALRCRHLHKSKWEQIVLISADINNAIEGMCLTNG